MRLNRTKIHQHLKEKIEEVNKFPYCKITEVIYDAPAGDKFANLSIRFDKENPTVLGGVLDYFINSMMDYLNVELKDYHISKLKYVVKSDNIYLYYKEVKQ